MNYTLLMGVAACVLAATGFYLWIRRHRGKQPRTARLLAALAVGVCAGLLLGTGGLLVAGQLQAAGLGREAWHAPLFWSLWAATILLVLVMAQHATLLRGLILATGVSYMLAGLLHAIIAAVKDNAFLFWQADVVLVLLGVLLLRHAWIQGRDRPRVHAV